MVSKKSAKSRKLTTETSTTTRSRKRKLAEDETVETIDPAISTPQLVSAKKRQRKVDANEQSPEKRLKLFRTKCPQAVAQRLDRVREQRMFCLGRERNVTNTSETFNIAGSTGNVYQVTICRLPACTCPDSSKNGTCKHILFVMTKVLRVRTELSYQAALVTSELEEIFASAPLPSDGDVGDHCRKRKPLNEDECPICYEAFDGNKNDTVYCKAQCGTNIHKQCFKQWAASRGAGNVTCVMCRSKWEEGPPDSSDFKTILQGAKFGEDGYLNVADQLGLSAARDTSTYHTPWKYAERPRYRRYRMRSVLRNF